MKSSSALTAAKTVIRWLRWAAVLALVCSALGEFFYFALGPQGRVLRPALFAVVQNLVFMLFFRSSASFLFVAVGAKIAPRARLTTAIVLAAVHVPLSLWNHVLSRVSLVEFVLLQGGGNYTQFILETLGAVLGVVYIFWSEKAGQPPTPAKAAPTAGKSVIRWLRWAAVLALVCSALGALVYSALGELVFSELGPQARDLRPAPLAVVQNLVFMLFFRSSFFVFVAAGAKIAPRARRTTAIVLAAALVALSFRNHVLSMGGPWWFWTINYTHFTLEALGAVLGVVYIFWSEKAKGSVASVPPSQ
jgi:hypothetical protein